MSLTTPEPQRYRLAEAIAVLALTTLVVLFFWKMIFGNLIVARGDLFHYFYPYRDYAAAAVRDGRVPLWNPYLFMGAPLVANSQVGFFYPVNLAMSWLEVTRAVNLNIVLHVWIATIGGYALARRRLGISMWGAWLAGVSFSLGGYLGTQVEHFNQLQALAWIPWLWLVYDNAVAHVEPPTKRGDWLKSAWPGLVIGLMFLAGHTQTIFIALVGLAAYAAWPVLEALRARRQALRLLVARSIPLAIGVLIGVLLAAVQLLPTTELTGLSPRGGGLSVNDAVSFSLDPRLLGRALLPDYDSALSGGSEFAAFFGVSALVLMVAGLLVSWLPTPSTNYPASKLTIRGLSIVALLGIFFALGGFNPLYYLFVRFVPGFDLFRAPARWLALFVFGGSMLSGVGLDILGHGFARKTRIQWVLPIALIALLILSVYLAAAVTPAGAAGPLGAPSLTSLLAWGIAAVATLLIARAIQSPISNLQSLLVAVCCLELFLATRALPYNARLTAPDALASLRPSLAQLQVGAESTPPGRFLSISDIQFDPGDSAELATAYADQLSPDAYYDLIVATKEKEIAAPNLPLYYRLLAVDGFDGGVLPLRNYLSFQRLFLPPDAIQSDGRLREQLKSIPDARWLDLMNVKYVITDKVRDRWLDGVFYDLQFATPLAAGELVETDQLPPLEANALGVVYTDMQGEGALARLELIFEDGSLLVAPVEAGTLAPDGDLSLTRLRWEPAGRVASVTLRAASNFTLRGVALVDERSDTFQSFVLSKGSRFRLAHSGDVKIYENVDALPRAFVVPEARFAASDEEALAVMRDADFDPREAVVLQSAPFVTSRASPVTSHTLRFTHYAPEHIVIEVASDGDGYLVLTDAWYPGWTATIDGAPVDVLRADVLFRAVAISAGVHRVELRFEPLTVQAGGAVSSAAWLVVVGWLAYAYFRRGR